MECIARIASRAAAAATVGEREGGGGGGDLQVTYRPRVGHDAREAGIYCPADGLFSLLKCKLKLKCTKNPHSEGGTNPLKCAVVADPRTGLENEFECLAALI